MDFEEQTFCNFHELLWHFFILLSIFSPTLNFLASKDRDHVSPDGPCSSSPLSTWHLVSTRLVCSLIAPQLCGIP